MAGPSNIGSVCSKIVNSSSFLKSQQYRAEGDYLFMINTVCPEAVKLCSVTSEALVSYETCTCMHHIVSLAHILRYCILAGVCSD